MAVLEHFAELRPPITAAEQGACVLQHEGQKPIAIAALQRYATGHKDLLLAALRGRRRHLSTDSRPGRDPAHRTLARGAKRFAHLLRPENAHLVAEIQASVDRDWEALRALCASDAPVVDEKGAVS